MPPRPRGAYLILLYYRKAHPCDGRRVPVLAITQTWSSQAPP